jgi:single-strand DNA-binding protein
MNQIIIEGNLGSDPEVKMLKDEVLASFSLAHTPRKKVNGQYEDGETIWFRVAFWNSKSDLVIEHLRKGDRISVIGKLSQSTYTTKDGETKTSLEISGTDFYLKPKSKPKTQASSFIQAEDVPSW